MISWRWSENREEYTAILNGMIIALLLVLLIMMLDYRVAVEGAYQQCINNLTVVKSKCTTLNLTNFTS